MVRRASLLYPPTQHALRVGLFLSSLPLTEHTGGARLVQDGSGNSYVVNVGPQFRFACYSENATGAFELKTVVSAPTLRPLLVLAWKTLHTFLENHGGVIVHDTVVDNTATVRSVFALPGELDAFQAQVFAEPK